jgi:hypothetical protein
MIQGHGSAHEFFRLHRLLLSHLALATAASWSMAVYAGLNTPWVANIVFLIDPTSSRVEATGSYLFTFPALLLVALGVIYFGRETLLRLRVLRNQSVEFAIVGAAFFTLFILSIERANAALRLGWL